MSTAAARSQRKVRNDCVEPNPCHVLPVFSVIHSLSQCLFVMTLLMSRSLVCMSLVAISHHGCLHHFNDDHPPIIRIGPLDLKFNYGMCTCVDPFHTSFLVYNAYLIHFTVRSLFHFNSLYHLLCTSRTSLPNFLSLEAIREGEELPTGDSVNSGKVFGKIGGTQLSTLLSSCLPELSVIASACLDLISTSLSNAPAGKQGDQESSEGESVDLVMACTCVRWLTVAFPSPLLESTSASDTAKKGKKALKPDSNCDKFSRILRDLSLSVTRAGDATSSLHSLAHHTQLLVSVLNQDKLMDTEGEGRSVVLSASVKECQNALPHLVRRYVGIVTEDPHSVASVWAILGTSYALLTTHCSH